jgi:NAD(P)-dependent dehydrogenase (short-subunit alcohol dehydrogenase family)
VRPSHTHRSRAPTFPRQNNGAVNNNFPGQDQLSTRALLTHVYNTNVFGTASMIAAFLPLLELSDYPRIVNMTSGLGSLAQMGDVNSPFFDQQFIVRRGRRPGDDAPGAHEYAGIQHEQDGHQRAHGVPRGDAAHEEPVHARGQRGPGLQQHGTLGLAPPDGLRTDVCRRPSPASPPRPARCPTRAHRATDYAEGTQDPNIGAAGIVRVVTAEKGGVIKTGQYLDQFGKEVPW